MPRRQAKPKQGGYEVRIGLSRRDLIDMLLARRRLQDILLDAERQLFISHGDLYLALEYAVSVVDTLVRTVEDEVTRQGFTWNTESRPT